MENDLAQDYRTVIGILSDCPDWKQICIEVAKLSPSTLIKAHQIVTNGANWEVQVLNAKRDDPSLGVVSAIKLCRSITGWSLKDAKDPVFDLFRREGFKI